ncbi:antiterminator LoaP [Paenibacillus sp. NPDC055715]
MKWYVVHVKTGEEYVAKLFLENKFEHSVLQCLIPKRIVPEKKNGKIYSSVKLLFPGYLFIKTHMTFENYYEIKMSPNVYNILNYLNLKDRICDSSKMNSPSAEKDSIEEDFFKSVPDEEMLIILKLLDNDTIGYSGISVEGSKVFVQSGPLRGMEHIIKKIDKRKKRAKISLNILDTERVIDVGINIVPPMT